MADQINEGKLADASSNSKWSSTQESGYEEAGLKQTAGNTYNHLLPDLGIWGHDGKQPGDNDTHPDFSDLSDPEKGLSVIMGVSNWVKRNEESNSLDPRVLAEMLMNFAELSVKHWPKDLSGPKPPEGQFEVYKEFDRLLEKLEDLNQDNPEWFDPDSSNSAAAFYKKLPWHFLPQSN